MCQKALGGPFAAYTGVHKTALSWDRGTPSFFRSSSTTERGFCQDCGTPLSVAFLNEDRIDVTIHSLDNPAAVAEPERQVGMESRAQWLDGINALPGSETEEFSDTEIASNCLNHQHPDHETPDGWAPQS
jgi:hypothetical protein